MVWFVRIKTFAARVTGNLPWFFLLLITAKPFLSWNYFLIFLLSVPPLLRSLLISSILLKALQCSRQSNEVAFDNNKEEEEEDTKQLKKQNKVIRMVSEGEQGWNRKIRLLLWIGVKLSSSQTIEEQKTTMFGFISTLLFQIPKSLYQS